MRKTTLMALVSAVALMTSGGVLAQSGLDGAIPGSGDGQPGQTDSQQKPRDMPEAQTPPDQATIPGESAASEARIRAMLEKQGYGDVQNIQKQGDAYIATATKEGERVQVRIDPQLGQIEEHGR